MSQSNLYRIFCIVLGAGPEDVFSIKIEPSACVDDLRDKIKEKKANEFANIDASELRLYDVELDPEDNLVERANAMLFDRLVPSLAPRFLLEDVFDDPPSPQHVHIVVRVQPRPKRKLESDSDEPVPKRNKRPERAKRAVTSPLWCPRTDTVSGVLDMLHDRHLIQFCGPPASGKTTLLHLLHAQIMQEKPNAQVFIYEGWPKETLKPMMENKRLKQMLPGYPNFSKGDVYFLFDDAHNSYWDFDLWLVFKDYIQCARKPVYAVISCNYGHLLDQNILYAPVPLRFGDASVTIDGFHWCEPLPYRLLMDEREFRDMVRRREPNLLLADDLRDFVYCFTQGHVGAIVAIVDFLMKKRGASMVRGAAYDLEDFHQDTLSYDEFCTHLLAHDGLRRGVPLGTEAAEHGLAMNDLVPRGCIRAADVDDDTCSRLKKAHKAGFINLQDGFRYFVSPVHQQLWSWLQVDNQFPFQDLFSLVKDAISYFQPLEPKRSDSPPGHRPQEAQYKEAYYRCLHQSTCGNVRISPEYASGAGSRPGRIDFFIPWKKWGVELTRDGMKLNEHEARFASEDSYEQWLKSSDMNDYALLDFCKAKPTQAHPGTRNLYHVVLSTDETRFEIYDNHLDLRAEGTLMYVH